MARFEHYFNPVDRNSAEFLAYKAKRALSLSLGYCKMVTGNPDLTGNDSIVQKVRDDKFLKIDLTVASGTKVPDKLSKMNLSSVVRGKVIINNILEERNDIKEKKIKLNVNEDKDFFFSYEDEEDYSEINPLTDYVIEGHDSRWHGKEDKFNGCFGNNVIYHDHCLDFYDEFEFYEDDTDFDDVYFNELSLYYLKMYKNRPRVLDFFFHDCMLSFYKNISDADFKWWFTIEMVKFNSMTVFDRQSYFDYYLPRSDFIDREKKKVEDVVLNEIGSTIIDNNSHVVKEKFDVSLPDNNSDVVEGKSDVSLLVKTCLEFLNVKKNFPESYKNNRRVESNKKKSDFSSFFSLDIGDSYYSKEKKKKKKKVNEFIRTNDKCSVFKKVII